MGWAKKAGKHGGGIMAKWQAQPYSFDAFRRLGVKNPVVCTQCGMEAVTIGGLCASCFLLQGIYGHLFNDNHQGCLQCDNMRRFVQVI